MELRHLRYFVAVAKELHFGNAAKRVHIAQPALSIQIRQLEDMLGGKLFRRTRPSVELTVAGSLFLAEAQQILRQIDNATRVAQRALRGELGRIEIGYTANAACSGILEKAIKAMRQDYPDIQ